MKKYIVLKLIGLAMLAMITLVIISILEVTLYSYVVNPGQEVSVYEAHAKFSAPFVSGIFGFIVFFLIARHWKKKECPLWERTLRCMFIHVQFPSETGQAHFVFPAPRSYRVNVPGISHHRMAGVDSS